MKIFLCSPLGFILSEFFVSLVSPDLGVKKNTAHLGCIFLGGERGIRTLGDVAASPLFESGQFNHSCTSPYLRPLYQIEVQ